MLSSLFPPDAQTVSRLNSLEAAVHRLNVQFYHMDVRVSQFSQGLAELKGGLAEASESLASLNEVATRNQKELGRIDGEDGKGERNQSSSPPPIL